MSSSNVQHPGYCPKLGNPTHKLLHHGLTELGCIAYEKFLMVNQENHLQELTPGRGLLVMSDVPAHKLFLCSHF